ncbi:MAG TPA: ClC family H(+)/Cl(-) exchange transporter [Candidatus Eisenbacteria bacterium]|nr:ClC family H(+)/Cl(-) exchange transporter [Candidatus Eisenbacteria bacterium]
MSAEDDSTPSGITFWLAVLATGLAVGAISVGFHAGLDYALAARERFTAWARPVGPAGFLLLVALCAAAVATAVWMTARFAPQAAGSGIQHVEGLVRGLLPPWPAAICWVKFVGGILGIGGGLVLGREGPTVQMGAWLAERISSRFGLTADEQRTLLVVGAGAGLTGAFNAPLAGTLFVVEELKCPLRPPIYVGTLVASILTDFCCRRLLGIAPELMLPNRIPLAWGMLWPVLVVGVLGGVLGAFFNRALLATFGVVDGLKRRVPSWTLGLAMGAVVGAVAWFVPALPGGGIGFAARLLDGTVSATAVAWLLPLSIVLTIGSYVLGAPGGIFAPLLVIGAALGMGVGGIWSATIADVPGLVPIAVAVGMAGLFAGVVRSPLTGAVLLLEMTGSAISVLPLLVASLAAYGVAEVLGSRPIYESLLEREVARVRAS